jgi:hypothetical protein
MSSGYHVIGGGSPRIGTNPEHCPQGTFSPANCVAPRSGHGRRRVMGDAVLVTVEPAA